MNRFCWWCVQRLSFGLAKDEREAVLGDLMESGESAIQASLQMAGLVIRRQAGLWQDWRPWLALFGIAGLAGYQLSTICFRVSDSIIRQISTYQQYGVHLENGVTFGADVTYLSCLLIAFLVWLWISGFALGSLSGSATWFNGSFFWFVLGDSFWLRLVLSGNIVMRHPHTLFLVLVTKPLFSPAVLTLPVAVLGMRQGANYRVMNWRKTAAFLLVVATLSTLLIWMEGWYETAMQSMSQVPMSWSPWYSKAIPLLLVSWPVWYLLATSTCTARRKMK